MNAILRLLRPRQWIKNGFVFAPLFFAGKFMHAEAWLATCEAALLFLSISCVTYIINDIRDAKEDRQHPVKKNRPIASGELTPFTAAFIACGFAASAEFFMLLLPYPCAVVAVIYLGLNALYTFRLKRIAIIDIFFIAFYYVLRVLMGCYALSVVVSPWIILTTFLLALFLGFAKRYHEMGFDEYVKIKPNLQHYNRELLDRLVTITGCAALITYAIYAAEVATRTGKVEMIYTTGFVAFGLFRYLQSVYVYAQGGEPETIFFHDKWQLANMLAWLVVTMGIMF